MTQFVLLRSTFRRSILALTAVSSTAWNVRRLLRRPLFDIVAHPCPPMPTRAHPCPPVPTRAHPCPPTPLPLSLSLLSLPSLSPLPLPLTPVGNITMFFLFFSVLFSSCRGLTLTRVAHVRLVPHACLVPAWPSGWPPRPFRCTRRGPGADLVANLDVLDEALGGYDDDYIIFDCPGQVCS